ncbi:MAG: hypothetical protein AB7O38_00140 [Pirellulaceae bacterium]
MDRTSDSSRIKTITLIVMTAIILLPVMVGFMAKLYEFFHTFRDSSEGVFAITPITNYLLASIGFLCMLVWATMNGMFHDIESPKYHMLDVEQQLDNHR